MLSYKEVMNLDDELFQFHLRQRNYYSLEGKVITWESLSDDMIIPEGFDEADHHIVKGYLNNTMVALVDYQYGYRFSMTHDQKCVWIGLFLIDQDHQNLGLGKEVLNDCLKDFQSRCNRVQLACLKNNIKGLAFWKKCGFYEIGKSKYGDLPLIVLEKII